MTDENVLLAAVSAAVADSEQDHAELLRGLTRTATAIFGASASSVLLLDEETDELVFEAVSREEESGLIGRRFPATSGIAGWVVMSREPVVVGDLSTDSAFARDVAESTGYVPGSLMAAPLMHGDDAIGVIEVMDYTPTLVSTMSSMEVLALFAQQAAVALQIVRRNRTARRVLRDGGTEFTELFTMVRTLLSLDPQRRSAGLHLLDSVGLLMQTPPESSPL